MTPDKAKSLANDIGCAIATLQAVADELLTCYPSADYRDDDPPWEDEPTPTEPQPKPKPTIKLEDVRAVLAEKSRSGKQAEVKALLAKYGVVKLSDISQEHYADLLEDAEGL
jgi:hypothetical protein